MSNELKRCPFCGGQAKYSYSDYLPGLVRVICDKCEARTTGIRGDNAKETVTELWNKRAVNGAPAATLEQSEPAFKGTEKIPKWYFTFGSDSGFPFQGGWVEIEAPTEEQAIQVFRTYWPDRHQGILNCAFHYSESEFQNTDMYKGKYPSEYCHAKVSLKVFD